MMDPGPQVQYYGIGFPSVPMDPGALDPSHAEVYHRILGSRDAAQLEEVLLQFLAEQDTGHALSVSIII